MTSLAEAYDRRAGEVGRRRLFLGIGVFVAGAVLVVLAILVGATPLPMEFGLVGRERWSVAREIAGVLAGIGVPAVFVGIFAVLPASAAQRAAAAIGAALALVGVVLFQYAYPYRWYADFETREPTVLALLAVGVFFVGTLTTFWCLFTAAATFKRRNDPGGTVSISFERGGETRTVEVAAADADAARAALGGVGVIGDVDRLGADADRTTGSAGDGDGAGGGRTADSAVRPTSDGGASTNDIRSPAGDGEVIDDAPAGPTGTVDRYCGNCARFEYVRTDRGIQPYCGAHDERMDDMEACPRWEPNR